MHRKAKGATEQRQVFVVKLILQSARAGGHQHPQAGQQHRNQVAEGLAGAGSRLDDQQAALLQGIPDAFGHVQLLAARNKPFQGSGKAATSLENVL
jgi:hypothetical protein